MTGDDLFDYVKTITSRADFIKFVDFLHADYRVTSAQWDNQDVPSFLSALAGFATDMAGYYKNSGETVDIEVPTWRLMAEMLLAATIYGA